MAEHYRVMISLIHVKTDTEQPELNSYSLPGFRSRERAEEFYLKCMKVISLIQNLHARVDRITLRG